MEAGKKIEEGRWDKAALRISPKGNCNEKINQRNAAKQTKTH